MRILGLGLSHCCGVCLIEDEKIVFAQEEDRFSRRRRHKGWPEQSLAYLFERYGLDESDIDLCVLSDIQTAEQIGRTIKAKETVVVHHHLAHIMSGWAMVDWDEFDAVSIDGGGDFGSWQSFGAVRDRELVAWASDCGSRLKKDGRVVRGRFNRPKTGSPFGRYWSAPAVLNFGMVDQNGVGGYEGKLMGLAGHGSADAFDARTHRYQADYDLKRWGDWHYLITSGSPKIGDPDAVVRPNGERYSLDQVKRIRKQEKRILAEYDLKQKNDFTLAADFAAHLQAETNRVIDALCRANFSPERPLVLTGGTFGNVVVNGRLNESYRLFVTPPMGDDGLSLGAAAWGAYLKGIRRLEPVSLPCLGFDAGTNRDVDLGAVARLLADKRVVGLMEGPMEYGPRALGARTIMSDPQDADVNFTINERLGRVEYMPFAPVILAEQANEILVGWSPEDLSCRHMTLIYEVQPHWRDRLKGVVHVDGTVRPQVLWREDNPVYYDILSEYHRLTGIPVLINTSFNAHGEPILRTVDQGRQALESGRVDALVAGNELTIGRNSAKAENDRLDR